MKDNKSSVLVFLSSVLLLLLLVLMGFWGYDYFERRKASNAVLATPTKENTKKQTADESTRDSLQKMYAATVASLDNTLDSTWTNADSLKGNLDIRLSEFYKLRTEINTILKSNPNAVDLGVARQKIGELQQKVEDLRNRNNDVEAENKRLYALLQQLNTNTKKSEQPLRVSSKTAITETPQIFQTAVASLFTASQLKLAAISSENNAETTNADDVDKLVGSFVVKNNGQLSGAEIIIVVTQPNGKVLKNSAWETGLFETKEDGRKMYSQKLRFDYTKGETKRCNFSLSADKYPKGNYTLQIYHNGVLIANTVKTLS